MYLLQLERNQVNNGWSKTDSKYVFAPARENQVNNGWSKTDNKYVFAPTREKSSQ